MSFTNTYTALSARLKDYLNDKPGGNVSNLPLDLLNRAQYELWQMKTWDHLVKSSALTMSGASATLPTDFGRMVCVYHDSDGDGKPDFYYYRDAEVDNGYSFKNTFAKATGNSYSITFFTIPTATPRISYVQKLVDFTGTGTEYSYFPGELLLNKAKLLHMDDGMGNDAEYAKLLFAFNKGLNDYIQQVQYSNNDQRMDIKDNYGNRVYPNEVNLADGSVNSYPTEHANDVRYH